MIKKFRVWDKVNNKWFSQDILDILPLKVFLSSENIQQFTGLLDKNNKEIYEGDLLAWSSWVKESSFAKKTIRKHHIVEWSNKKGCWFIENDTWNLGIFSDIEIIGNIFENSEFISNE